MKPSTNWLDFLNDEDSAFLKRFLLASGSLKTLAEIYGVTYPTIRLRLDKLIQKVEVIESHQDIDPFERHLRGVLAEGKMEPSTFKDVLSAYRRTSKTKP